MTTHTITFRIALAGAFFALALVFLSACSSSDFPGASGSSGYSVVGSPTITAAKINSVLCKASSPACGTGKQLYDAAVGQGIDPVYGLAWFRKESTYGKFGVARAALGLGNIRCVGWPGRCIEGYRAYDSWAAGYRDWAKLIKVQYVEAWKLTTVDAIVRTYAPSSENNTVLYIQQVQQYVDEYRSGGAA
jgi:hypothetical protein